MDYFNDVQLKPLFNEGGISFGELEGNFKNHYYVLSDPKIAKLLNSPEIVGFDVYKALLPATSAVLCYATSANSISCIRSIFSRSCGAR